MTSWNLAIYLDFLGGIICDIFYCNLVISGSQQETNGRNVKEVEIIGERKGLFPKVWIELKPRRNGKTPQDQQ